MQLRFEEGDDTSNTALNSYYNCYHEGDGDGEEGEEEGVDVEEYDMNEDVSPLLPSPAAHHNDNYNNNYNDTYKNNDVNDDVNDDDDIDKDRDSDSKDEDEDEDEINSVQTLRMESKFRSPCPLAFQESSLSFNTIKAIKELIKESNKGEDKNKEPSAAIHSRSFESNYKAEECSLSHDDACDKSYLDESQEEAIKVENNESNKRNNEKLIESNTHDLKDGDKDEKKDEDKSSDGESDSDCDTVPSPTPPPTLSTIPPSSAARKTLSMESRDPRISLTRRVSQAPPTASTPAPTPTRSPRVSTQRMQYPSPSPSPRPVPSMVPSRALDKDMDSDSDSGSSSGSYDSSSGEDFNFNMPSAMSLQDTVRQRSKTLHSESTFLSRPSNAFKLKKKEEEEQEEKAVEKSEMTRLSSKKACVAASEEVGVPCMQCQTQTQTQTRPHCIISLSSPLLLSLSLSPYLPSLSFSPPSTSPYPSYRPFHILHSLFYCLGCRYVTIIFHSHYNNNHQQGMNTSRSTTSAQESLSRPNALPGSEAPAPAASSLIIRSRRSSTGGSTIFSRMSGASHLDAESDRRQSSSGTLFPLPFLDPHMNKKNRKSFLRESMSPPNLLKMHKKNTSNQVDAININEQETSKSNSNRNSPSTADISLHSLHIHKSSPDAWQKQFAERVLKIQNRDKTSYSKSCPKTSTPNTVSVATGGGVLITPSPERERNILRLSAMKNTDVDLDCARQGEDVLLLSINYLQCKGEKKEKEKNRVVKGEEEGEGVGEGEQPGVREGDLYYTDSSLPVASTAGLVPSKAHTASTTPAATAAARMDAYSTDIGPDSTQNSSHHIPTSTLKSSGPETAITTVSNSNVAHRANAVQASSSSPLVGVKRSAAERAFKALIAPLSSKSGCPLSPPRSLPLSPPQSHSHSKSREECKSSLSSDSSPLHFSPPLPLRTRQRVVKAADDALNPFESLLLQHKHTPASPTTLIPLPGPLPLSLPGPLPFPPLSLPGPLSLPVSLPVSFSGPLPVSPAPAHKPIIEPEPPCSPNTRKDFTFIDALMGKVNISMQNTLSLSPVKYPPAPSLTPSAPQLRSSALTFEQKLLRVESQIPGGGLLLTSSASPLPLSSPSRSFKEKKGGGGRVVRAFSPMRSDVNNRAAQGEGGDDMAAAHTVPVPVPAPLTPPRAALYDAVAVAVHSSSSKMLSSSSSLSQSQLQLQSQLQRDAVSPLTDKRRVRINHQHHERENIAKIANLPHYQQPLARSAVSGSRAKQMTSPVTNPNPTPNHDTK